MEEKQKVFYVVGGFFLLVLIVFLLYYFVFRDKGEEVPAEVPVPEKTAEVLPKEEIKEPAEEIETLEVDLAHSDELLREMAAKLSARPEFLRWLLTEDMIRKFAAAVDNVSNGQSPRKHIGFFKPGEDFKVLEADNVFTLDPAGYKRYAQVAEVFASLDAPGFVRLYKQMKNAVQEAYQDLGYPNRDFTLTFLRAIDELLAVPVLEKDILLEKKLISYVLADPELEQMSDAQKHLLRMGPVNIRKIQSKLEELKVLLD